MTVFSQINMVQADDKINWKTLNLKDALVFKQGNGNRKMAVITDIDCGYCKNLESELQKLDNVTIYKFITPIRGNTSQATSIWCASNRNKAYLNKMLMNKPPVIASCKNPINQNLKLIDKLGVVGTPMIINENGSYSYGTQSKDQLEGFLQ